MNESQENQLIFILSDYVPIMDGDSVKGIHPEATKLTRQKLIIKLKEDLENMSTDEESILDWYGENIQLLEAISDQEFQPILDEKILLTELQIGHSIFEPLNQQQLDRLTEKLADTTKKTQENGKYLSEKAPQPVSRLGKIFKVFRQK